MVGMFEMYTVVVQNHFHLVFMQENNYIHMYKKRVRESAY